MSEDLISKEKAYEVLSEYYHHKTEIQHKALREALDRVPPVELQPTCNPDKISQFIDGIERMFADIRERFIDDSVCGLCEYDGAYVGESGDWCNECPGFEKDDCFKLSDKTRKEWTAEIIKALGKPNMVDVCETITEMPSAEQGWIPVSERLPEPNQMVLISINGEVDADWIAVDNTGYKSWYRCMRDVTSVDAWMPLPKPWKGGE